MLTKFTSEWWRELRHMPLDDADTMLKETRQDLLEQNIGKSSWCEAGKHLTRVNDELKRIRTIRHNAQWQMAMRQVLTPELYDQCCQAKRRLEIEAGDES